MSALHKYWFAFEKIGKPTPLNLGCGVTAYDQADAIDLMKRHIFGNHEIPGISHVTDDIEFENLNQGHVAPNVGDMDVRGIWFPQGYDEELR
jgi:hypothetical protein